jgi:multidrug efflux pump subunit AcrA (membrane-fusion protein)
VEQGPEVKLHAEFAGRQHVWLGRIVRTHGEIDSRTRQVTLIAQVEDPYGPTDDKRPPLAVGMFVQAEILGRRYQDVVVLPRSAIRDRNKVLVIDEAGRLHFREVDILRSDRDQVLIQGGLESGELLCLSILEAVTEGMKVQVSTDGEGPAVKRER